MSTNEPIYLFILMYCRTELSRDNRFVLTQGCRERERETGKRTHQFFFFLDSVYVHRTTGSLDHLSIEY